MKCNRRDLRLSHAGNAVRRKNRKILITRLNSDLIKFSNFPASDQNPKPKAFSTATGNFELGSRASRFFLVPLRGGMRATWKSARRRTWDLVPRKIVLRRFVYL